jgi:hypothetical protein
LYLRKHSARDFFIRKPGLKREELGLHEGRWFLKPVLKTAYEVTEAVRHPGPAIAVIPVAPSPFMVGPERESKP